MSWANKTSFVDNEGTLGGALYVWFGAFVSWSAKTSFEGNRALSTGDSGGGGALKVSYSGRAAWNGTTTFAGEGEVMWPSFLCNSS